MKRFGDGARLALLLATVCSAPFALCAPAAAQGAEGQTTASNSNDEVVVTARRREERLQDVPIAVSSYTADQLDAAGAQDITAVAQSAPNVTLENSRATNSTLTAFIRGIGQQDPVAGFEQGVGIYLDDVYLNRPQAAVLDIYDLDRIEVLRGPQGTLYGRNTIGGAVKYVTRRLDRNDPTLRARVAYGSYNQEDLVLSGSLPLGDQFRVGGAIASLNRDGFGHNLTTGEDNYNKDILAGRISAEWEPTSNFLARLSLDYTQDDSAPRQGHRLIASGISGSSPLHNVYDTEAGITALGPLHHNSVLARGIQLQLDWQPAEHWTVRSITAHRDDSSTAPIDFDSTAAPTMDVPAVYRNDQLSQEFQVLYDGDRLHFVGGAYYLEANAFDAFDVRFTSITSFTLGDVDTRTWAVFGEASYDITPTLSLTVGGRYTEDQRHAHVIRQTFLSVPSPYFGGPGTIGTASPVPSFTGERTDTAFTPRVILDWRPSDTVNLYASYSQGFKGGGFDPRGNFANPDVRAGYLPETVDSYEIGAKTQWWDNRVTANVAVFDAEYQDVQIPGSVIVAGPPVSFVGTVTNAGAARITGIEFEGMAQLTEALNVNLSFGYMDARYTEFIVGGVNVASQRDIQNAPDWAGSVGATYEIPLALGADQGALAFTGAASYRGFTQQFENSIPLLDQPGYWLYDAAVYWRSHNDRWRVGVYGRNLSDERYITSGYNFPTIDHGVTAFYGNPRTVTAQVEVRF
ncbi:MAG: TonB-dependent receptor [Proteobacteria bacterium]|nr:TonB-dependent receptor [Pseudomonadota bacterium]